MTVSVKSKIKAKLTLLRIVLLLAFVVFMVRLVWLQIIDHGKFIAAANGQQNTMIDIQAKRGIIYDRNMRVLAQDIESYSYYVIPENIKEPKATARTLARLTGQSDWLTKFKKHPRFLFVARKTSSELSDKLHNAGIETLHRFIEPKRVYPAGQLALPILGKVDIDNKGLSGLELQFDKYISGKNGKNILKRDGLGHSYSFNDVPLVAPEPGSDLICSIDLNLQQIVEQELTVGMEQTNAAHGVALFLKVGTGEILACATFDSLGAPTLRNRAITDQYEPGSTFKIITTALALSSGKFELNDIIDVEHGRFQIGRRTIRDDHEYDTLSVEDVLVYSSNIGTSKMALALGEQRLYKAIKEAGFVNTLGVDFPGEADGYIQPPEWRDHYLANVSFGHGISASPLQMAALYDAVVSDGFLSRPFFGKELIEPDGTHKLLNKSCRIRQVFRQEITHVLQRLLCEVVERGTATKGKSDLVKIGGKTGTALKVREDGRGYDWRRSRASFVGFFPADNPMVVGIIVFDEPKNSRYGGETAVPVFKNIAERYYCLPDQLREHYVESKPKQVIDAAFASADTTSSFVEALEASARYYQANQDPDAVPDFRGLTVRQALKLASDKGLECDIQGSGVVQNQEPQPGMKREDGKIITLRCAAG
jgi:cell division protein FtsI (penicillin-binding protein 3)